MFLEFVISFSFMRVISVFELVRASGDRSYAHCEFAYVRAAPQAFNKVI